MKIDLTKFVYDEDDIDYDELMEEIYIRLKQRAEQYWSAGIMNFDDESVE